MCRWLAYWGEPVFLEEMLFAPRHSLVQQSLHARRAKGPTNGDGFGVGWFGEREEPGLYRDILPAWNDCNLRSLASQVRSRLFFAHVRASTGTAVSRENCHPFRYGRWLFMHNGQIGGYERLRRRLEALIEDRYYDARRGTTDSELIFLLLLGAGLDREPLAAFSGTIATVSRVAAAASVGEPTRISAAVTDGSRLIAVRWASDDAPPTLYWRQQRGRLIVVSEPLDDSTEGWEEVPAGGVLIADSPVRAGIRPLVPRPVPA